MDTLKRFTNNLCGDIIQKHILKTKENNGVEENE